MTNDSNKTKAELLAEIESLRARLAGHSLMAVGKCMDTHFREMVDGLPQIIYETDLEGWVTYVNAFAMKTYGYTRQDIENGVNIKDTIHPDSLEEALTNIGNAFLGKNSPGATYKALHKDGTHFPIKVFSQGIFKDGHAVGARGVVLDMTEIQQAEEALLKSENYYRTLFETTGTAMVIFGNDAVIHSCNTRFEELSGCSRQNIEGKMKWSAFVDPEELKRISDFHARRGKLDTDVPTSYDFIFMARDGVRKRVQIFIEIIPGTEDRVCSLIDITEREKIQEALRKSEERYELAERGANDGLWDWNLITDEVYYSPRYKEIIGYTGEEFPNIADSWKNAVHPDDIEHTIAANMECIEDKVDHFQVEYRMRHKNGDYRWVLGRGASAKDENGKVYRLAGTHTDITTRKMNERTTTAMYAISKAINTTDDLQHLYETIHQILDEVIDATNFYIGILDTKRDKIDLPYFEDENDKIYDIRDVSDPSTKSLTAYVVRTGEPLLLSREDILSPEMMQNAGIIGTTPAVWLGVPLKVMDTIIGAMAVQHYANPHHYTEADVTFMEAVSEQVALAIDRKGNEEALNRLNEELENKVAERTAELANKAEELEIANKRLTELDEVKSALVSSVSHELRTPLTSIRGFAKLAGKDFIRYFQSLADNDTIEAKGTRISQNLNIIEAEGERLTRLINDFLDINRIESGKALWHDRFLNPCEVIHQAVRSVEGSFADNPNVTLVTQLPDITSLIHTDPDKIKQVLINLLSNAGKFTLQGEVCVSVKPSLDTITVTVSDTGIGIPEAELGKIFERFHKSRSGDTLRTKAKGTGLGLAICKEIVEHYEGSIWVESKPGKGSTFSFTLPVVPGFQTPCT